MYVQILAGADLLNENKHCKRLDNNVALEELPHYKYGSIGGAIREGNIYR
jgi:hypothetical protein